MLRPGAQHRFAVRNLPAISCLAGCFPSKVNAQVMFPFRNRTDAGQMLATTLREYANRDDVVVLALPRGGVPVGFEVAKALHAPLDVFVVRKLGLPGQEELAMGAIASGGARVLNRELIRALRIPEEVLDQVTREEQRELERREREYRDGRPPIDVRGKTVILVDDGLATGSSMRAGVLALKQKEPAQVVVAVPVAPADSCQELQSVADRVVCGVTPQPFLGVGQWYEDFSQTSDVEVRELLRRARDLPSHRAA
jgi:predicted phosphoribosyltransferase